MIEMQDDSHKARQLLEQACKADELGNLKKAVTLFEKAAALGSSEAQVNLGNLYSEGRGVELSPKIAKSLYRSAFKGGCVYGASALGVQYKNEKKFRLARLWFEKAAALGEEWSKEELALLDAKQISGTRSRK